MVVFLALWCCSYWSFNPTFTGRSAGGNDMIDLLFRCCCQFSNRMVVKVLPVYTPSAEEQEHPIVYGNNIQRTMAAVLKLPVSDASYADYKKQMIRRHSKKFTKEDLHVDVGDKKKKKKGE